MVKNVYTTWLFYSQSDHKITTPKQG